MTDSESKSNMPAAPFAIKDDLFAGLPAIKHHRILELLEPPSRKQLKRVLIDTDTYNEIDDQFALIHMLLAQQQRSDLEVVAITAAPFHNVARDTKNYEHGMLLSYQEIHRVLDKLEFSWDGHVFKGASNPMVISESTPMENEAADAICEIALSGSDCDSPLYLIALGALTNVATAIIKRPEIRERIVVCTLGGVPFNLNGFTDFNYMQDMPAAQFIFSCGVPVVHFPGYSVTDNLRTSRWELEANLGDSAAGIFLMERYMEFVKDYPGRSKPIWDLAPGIWVIDPQWLLSEVRHSPLLTDENRWVDKMDSHPVRAVRWINRDEVFRNFYELLNTES